jgi:hypothetical protein
MNNKIIYYVISTIPHLVHLSWDKYFYCTKSSSIMKRKHY